jgi:hypothetical protein
MIINCLITSLVSNQRKRNFESIISSDPNNDFIEQTSVNDLASSPSLSSPLNQASIQQRSRSVSSRGRSSTPR